jgi:hypothetical protein
MKRILIFVLLFASGLALLVKLQGGASKTPDWNEQPSQVGELEDKLIGIPGKPVPAIEDAATVQTGETETGEVDTPAASAGINGRITDTYYPKQGGQAVYTFTADAETNVDGAIDLFDVNLEYFGKGVLTASKGRASLIKLPGALAPSIKGDSVSLEDVEMKLESGHPLAPMTVAGARLQGNLPKQTFLVEGSAAEGDQQARPSVSSPRFHFEAASIDLDGITQRLLITGDAIGIVFDKLGVELYRLTGDSIRVENTAPAPLELDPKTTPAPFEIFIDGDAKLTMAGELTATLSSNTLTLTGEHLPSGELSLSEVRVDGTGVLVYGASTFTGSSFDFDFDEAGESGSITVDGTPNVKFDLASLNRSTEQTPPLELDSDGPLTVSLDLYGTFETKSVTTLTWAETKLVAQTGIHGSLNPEATRLSVQATGGVTLDGEDESGIVHFATETMLLDYAEEGDSPRQVTLTSTGAANFTVEGMGVNEGIHMKGATGRSLRLAQVGDLWTIPEAHDIVLSASDATGELNARASDLADFDPRQRLLDARGDVVFSFVRDGETGSGSGDHVSMQGLDSVVIEGTEQTLAEFSSAGANISALRISREAAVLEASGAVDARLDSEAGLFLFTCHKLRVDGLPTADPEREGGLTDDEINALVHAGLSFSAEGEVMGTVEVGEDLLYLDCDLVSANQGVLETGQAEVVINAVAVRSATWQSKQAKTGKVKSWSMTAGKLTATVTERLSEELQGLSPTERAKQPALLDADFRLLADGKVTIQEQSSGFAGAGESLRLERVDGYFVRLDGGPQRAQVKGSIPSQEGVTYMGNVLWLEATETSLRAVEVDVNVVGLSFMDSDADKPLRLRSDLLEGVPGTLQLDGNVRLVGDTRDTPDIVLTSDHATFTNALLQQVDGKPSDLPFPVSFLAHGDVRLRQGLEFELFGTDLIVESGGSKVRIAGRPASISYAGLCATSSWIEFDPVLMAFECGRGRLSMDPLLLELLNKGDEKEKPSPEPKP